MKHAPTPPANSSASKAIPADLHESWPGGGHGSPMQLDLSLSCRRGAPPAPNQTNEASFTSCRRTGRALALALAHRPRPSTRSRRPRALRWLRVPRRPERSTSRRRPSRAQLASTGRRATSTRASAVSSSRACSIARARPSHRSHGRRHPTIHRWTGRS